MQPVSLDEAKTQLRDLVEAAPRGETVSIAVNDEEAVQLVPTVSRPRRRQFGSARRQIWMADDFDSPLEDVNV